MTDTAQPLAAAETDPIAEAANAFKAFTNEEPVVQARDETGKFASANEPEEVEESDEGEALEADEVDDGDDEEAAEEAQPMPTSWPADQADQWAQLPAETQSYLAKREAERDHAVNAKFQEAANVRKSALDEQAQAQTTREQLLQQIDLLQSVIQPVKPDPRAYGAGTGQYNREAYDLALVQFENESAALAQLQQQRDAFETQAVQEEELQFNEWRDTLESEYQPKFLADVPELTDPVKAAPTMKALVDYALANGVPERVFSEDNHKFITSPELHILWKAQQFDKLRASPPQAKPKASPAVKPGVSSPRSAQKAAQRARVNDRLAREGSVEAGAAMWKQHFK